MGLKTVKSVGESSLTSSSNSTLYWESKGHGAEEAMKLVKVRNANEIREIFWTQRSLSFSQYSSSPTVPPVIVIRHSLLSPSNSSYWGVRYFILIVYLLIKARISKQFILSGISMMSSCAILVSNWSEVRWLLRAKPIMKTETDSIEAKSLIRRENSQVSQFHLILLLT